MKLTNEFKPHEIVTFRMASGDMLQAIGCVDITLKVKDFNLPFTFHILKELSHDMILGTDFMTKFQAKNRFY